MTSIIEKETLRQAINNRLILFLTGMVQVLLVAVNTFQIAHEKWFGCIIVGFLISYIWTWNVKKIAFGGHLDRIVYAFGASVGTITGLIVSIWIYKV